MIVAVCLSTTSKGQKWTSIADSSLVSGLLPSLDNSLTLSDHQQYDVRVMIAYDTDDEFWLQHRKQVTSSLSVQWLAFDNKERRIPFNEVTQAAYEQGAEYIVRVNDDSRFASSNWLQPAIDQLRAFKNIGVVGPLCHEGNNLILTHDMTHRTHLEIFDTYYPLVFKNWWLDDWITKVYGKKMRIMKNWLVKHDTGKHGTRYKVDEEDELNLKRLLVEGKEKIAFYEKNNQKKRTVVAICASTTSAKQNWKSIQETSLVAGFFPSLYTSLSADEMKKQYKIRVYIAYDKGDDFWEKNAQEVRDLFMKEKELNKRFDRVVLHPFPKTGRIPFNEITQLAYDQGADYIVRVNDDTRFVTSNWVRYSIAELEKLGNVGVVGPKCNEGNKLILTHDMTHRNHLKIFDTYYPVEFKNWWLDDWITKVYQPKRQKFLSKWVVKHDTHKHGTRYKVDKALEDKLKPLLKSGKEKIKRFLKTGSNLTTKL